MLIYNFSEKNKKEVINPPKFDYTVKRGDIKPFDHDMVTVGYLTMQLYNDDIKDKSQAIKMLTRYFELLVYYEYYIALTCMNIQKSTINDNQMNYTFLDIYHDTDTYDIYILFK